MACVGHTDLDIPVGWFGAGVQRADDLGGLHSEYQVWCSSIQEVAEVVTSPGVKTFRCTRQRSAVRYLDTLGGNTCPGKSIWRHFLPADGVVGTC